MDLLGGTGVGLMDFGLNCVQSATPWIFIFIDWLTDGLLVYVLVQNQYTYCCKNNVYIYLII